MKKQILKSCSLLALVLCFGLLMGSIPTYAAIDNVTTEAEASEEEAGEEIVVKGLEGVKIKEIKDIVVPKTRSSCGIFHIWSVIGILQEGDCDTQGIYRVQCINCGATGTVLTDAPGHNYVNGACTNCGDGGSEVAPQAEIDNWTYTLNDTDNTITLESYVGASTDVVVYGVYKVNGVTYSTIINGGYHSSPFYNKASLTSIKIKGGVTSTDCRYLFSYCSNLTALDVSGLDTSKATDMEYMFINCSKLTTLDVSNFNTSKVMYMTGMFYGCSNLATLSVSNFDTSNVGYMNGMFYNCSKLTSLDVGNFDTSKVIWIGGMFNGCSSLTTLDVSNFDTSRVTDMRSMFEDCNGLTTLAISNFDTSNTTDFYRLFKNCSNLTSINLGNFDTSKVTNMYEMFYGCSSLTSIDVSNFDTSNVTEMTFMFYDCRNITSLDLCSFQTYNAEQMYGMFYDCSNLTTIYVNRMNWNTSFADTREMFTGCGTSKVTIK